MNAKVRRAIFPVTVIALIGVGAAFTWGWSIATLVVGGLLWIDLVWEAKR